MPVEAGVDLFAELERLLGEVDPVAPAAVLAELARLSETGTGTEAQAARVGQRLAAERCRTVEAPTAGDLGGADGAIVGLAAAGACGYVVTNDARLRDRVHAVDVPVISLRGQNKMAVIHP